MHDCRHILRTRGFDEFTSMLGSVRQLQHNHSSDDQCHTEIAAQIPWITEEPHTDEKCSGCADARPYSVRCT
jgi:hypothetical protein